MIVIAGVRITGGGGSETKAELFNPQSNRSCPLPPFSPGRYGHSSCADLLCGASAPASDTLRGSCSYINDASYTIFLREKRAEHLCWKLPGEQTGVLLLGGWDSPKTTERISGSSTSNSFTLPYETLLVNIKSLSQE